MRSTEYPPPDLPLAAHVLADPSTAAYVMACMTLGNAVRILCELKQTPADIHQAVTDCIRAYGASQGETG